VFARVFGWVVIGVGLSFALGIAAIAHLIFPAGFVGLAIGAPLALLSLIVGGLFLRGGRHLGERGASAERNVRTQALFALAANRKGTLTAHEASAALDMPLAAAEELLQSLAKEQYERVAVDVDSNGTLVYRFVVPPPAGDFQDSGAPRVRVDPEIARSPNRDEWERLEAEEAQRSANTRPRTSR
jgi:hypothetical protein